MKTFTLLIIAVLFCAQLVLAGPPLVGSTCDVSNPVNAEFHRMQLESVQNGRDEGKLWIQDVAVIANVPVSETTTQRLEIASFKFYQDNIYWQEGCVFNETQSYATQDPETGEIVYEMARIFIDAKAPHYRTNFNVAPPQIEKAQADYGVEWYKNAYPDNSAIVLGTTPIEYVLGPKVVSSGWYRQDGSVPYVNTIVNIIPGEYRTYTVNTFLEDVPGDASTTFKVIGDIDGRSGTPPPVISAAFEWFNQVIDDPSFVPEISSLTGLPRYVFRPSEHLNQDTRDLISNDEQMKPAVNIYDQESLRNAMNTFINESE